MSANGQVSSHKRNALEIVRERRLLLNAMDAWLLEMAQPHICQRVLEIGCGHGNLTLFLLNCELVLVTDFNPDCVEIVKARFADHDNLFAPDAIDSTVTVAWAFLAQVLRDGKEASCRAAVARIVA